jgi:hypothetical protein
VPDDAAGTVSNLTAAYFQKNTIRSMIIKVINVLCIASALFLCGSDIQSEEIEKSNVCNIRLNFSLLPAMPNIDCSSKSIVGISVTGSREKTMNLQFTIFPCERNYLRID